VTRVVSVALRVHDLEAMRAFYRDVFGADLRPVQVGPLGCWFGPCAGLLLKLVPLRDAPDPTGYPLHQLGVEVGDPAATVARALACGGRAEGPLCVRDPDGNTVELVACKA